MKIEEMREKSVKELNETVVDLKKQLFDIRFKKFTNKYENSTDLGKANSEIKDIRRNIARLKTVMNEKKSV